jgi:hypothetical protein
LTQALSIGGISLFGDIDGGGIADEVIEYGAFDEFCPFDIFAAIRAAC